MRRLTFGNTLEAHEKLRWQSEKDASLRRLVSAKNPTEMTHRPPLDLLRSALKTQDAALKNAAANAAEPAV